MSGGGSDKKRDDYPINKHRDNIGYAPRSRDEPRSNKRDDYGSPKRERRDNGDYKSRDSGYNKRGNDMNVMPPRHSSSSSGGNYNMGGGSHGGRVVNTNDDMIIMKPYLDQGGRGSSNDFRRNIPGGPSNMNNVTLIGGNPNGSGAGIPTMVIKDDRSRYMESSSQNEMRYGGSGGGGGGSNDRGIWINSPGPGPVKPFGTVQIQNDDWSQDRYDRTYNERKSPFMEPVRQSGSGSGVSFMNRPQDRYSRFDSGRF